MATTGALIFLANLSPTLRRETTSASGKLSRRRISNRSLTASSELTRTASAMTTTVADTETTPLRNLVESKGRLRSNYSEESEVTDEINAGMSLKDYFKEAKVMIRSDGGPPRWFSPLDCGSHAPDSPLLLYLPGIDGVGVGVGLVKQRQKLGQIFDIWCLHIPVKDRTSFTALIKLVEGTVRSESDRLPNRPIYILGESIGGCLALAVAARNPHIDLVLILANPATSFSRSQCQRLQPLLEIMPEQVLLNLPFLLNFFQSFLPPQISMVFLQSWDSRVHGDFPVLVHHCVDGHGVR